MDTPLYDVIIVGAGLSGLSTARLLKNERPDISLLLLEKSDRPGGAIRSHSEEGYLAEAGAHGYLDNCPESQALIGLAGLEGEMVKAPLAKFGRYICLGGELRLIPQQPQKIIAAKLLPLAAKLRVLADLWKKPLAGEPTVAQWVAYRFGQAMLPFADAVFTGTYAGDIERLKIGAVMPGLRELELNHGSVLKGLFKKHQQQKRAGQQRRELPAMTSFSAGMARLPQGLAAGLLLNKEIMYRTPVTGIVPGLQKWEVQTAQHNLRCRHLVLALPLNQTLALLKPTPTVAKAPAEAVPEARIATVALGFAQEKVTVPFGFGYLAPEQENRFTLGALFSSHMFADRAPRGKILLEALVGGRRHPERLELEDDELVRQVYQDLRELIDLPVAPSYARVLRPSSGIPQLEEDYSALLAWRSGVHAKHPNLHLLGFGWDGIGINDMTKHAAQTVHRILSASPDEERAPEVKGIYF